MPTTTIPSTLGYDPAAQAAAAPAATAAESTGSGAKTSGSQGFGMDKDAFLKILVEQLRHQDPSSPGDSQKYIEQMTQFSILEQLTNISENAQVQTASDNANTAIALVGRTVMYLDADDEEQSGVVKGVDFESGVPVLTVGDAEGISLGQVTEVR